MLYFPEDMIYVELMDGYSLDLHVYITVAGSRYS